MHFKKPDGRFSSVLLTLKPLRVTQFVPFTGLCFKVFPAVEMLAFRKKYAIANSYFLTIIYRH